MLSGSLKKYQDGALSAVEFKRELSTNKIELDSKMTQLIRRHEAGDKVTYMTFGREIFKQIEQQDGSSPFFLRSENINH